MSDPKAPQDHLGKKPPVRVPVTVVYDDAVDAGLRQVAERVGNLRWRVEQADQAVKELRWRESTPGDEARTAAELAEANDELAEAEAELDEWRARAASCSKTFMFKPVPRRVRRDLASEYPATAEAIQAAKDADQPPPPFDLDAYARPFVKLACVDAQGEDFDDEDAWNDGAILRLFFEGATAAQTDSHIADLGKGSARTPSSNGNSPTASPAESPTPVSWAGESSGEAS